MFCSRLSAVDPASANKTKSHRYCRHAQGKFDWFSNIFSNGNHTMFGILVGAAPATHNAKPNFDSGKSSDSSLSSSYRHGHEGGSLRMDQRSKTDNTYVKNFAQPTILSTRCFFWQHNKFTIRRARILHILFQLSKNSGEFQFAQYSARSTVFDRCENPVAIVFGVECHGR